MDFAKALFLQLMQKYGFEDWELIVDSSKDFALCLHGRKAFTLSTRNATRHDSDVIDCIAHAIAHAVVGPEHDHDSEKWREAAEVIGCRPEVKCDLVEAEYRAQCPKCGRAFYRTAMPKPGLYHADCGPKEGVLLFQ